MIEVAILLPLLLAGAIGYFFFTLYLLAQQGPEKTDNPAHLRVAVLVAMRNEQAVIADCLNSLARQDYPSHRYEVFVLDDRSTDRSAEIARLFCDQHANFHLHLINSDLPGLAGKMNVLAQGMQLAEHDLIMITDADCIVPETWIRTHASYFDNDVGMVGAFTSLEPLPRAEPSDFRPNTFGRVQALDWTYLQVLAAGNSNAGHPITILGNNFAFRREAYLATGGFEKIGFSVTEDFALMKAITQQTEWKVVHTLEAGNSIFSHPAEDIKAFFQQRRRWLVGGRKAGWWGMLVMGFSFVMHILALLVIILQLWKAISALAIGLMVGADYIVIKRQLQKLRLIHLKKYFPLFEIFYLAYTIVFGLLFFFPSKVRWKDRRL